MGLCEVDAGNDSAARGFLEDAATRTPQLPPRASFELARLRFAALKTQAKSQDVRLSSQQADPVLKPLLSALEQDPPLPEIYDLLAEVWSVGTEPPTRAQLAMLESGVRLFPHRAELLSRTAELNLRHGFPDTARWIINLGLTLAPDASTRARFESLQARLDRR
jgi:hypothetical protein